MEEQIRFTQESFNRFKIAHNTCIELGDETFTFDGHEFLLGYADYLIEYLESNGFK